MQLHEFFLIFAIVLIAARLFSELASRAGIPAVIGELAAGLLLGPSLLGWVSPDATMELLAEIGIILLLFEVGMDTDIYRLAQAGMGPVLVAVVGFTLPFVLGYGLCAWAFGLPELASLFIGGTLTATSIGITVRVLDGLGRRHADEAQVVLGAAVLDDILGVLTLAFLYQFAVQHEVSVLAMGKVSLFIVLFMLISPLAAKLMAELIDHADRRAHQPGLLLTMVLSLILLFSWLAHAVGAPVIMGGFAAGIAFGHQFRVAIFGGLFGPVRRRLERWFSPSPRLAHRIEEQMRPLIHTFTPLFFVMVGVSLDLNAVDWSSARVWLLGTSLLAVAFAGKLAAGFSIDSPRLQQAAVGLSMIPRGEVGLIFAQLGYNEHILSEDVYAALLIVIALTTLAPPFLLKWFYSRYGERV
jgi:Na+:H+ antiporter